MMGDKQAAVEEFLANTKGKSKQNLIEIVQHHFVDDVLINEIFHLLEYLHLHEKAQFLCQKLFEIHSHGSRECAIFVLQFVPALIWAYLSERGRLANWSPPIAETLLLAIHNKVVSRNVEAPYENSFRIPSISKPSIYHEPGVLIGKSPALTEQNVSRHDKSDTPLFARVVTESFDRLPAGLRSTVLATVLEEFNKNISFYSTSALDSLCRLAVRMSCCGTTWRPENMSALLGADEVSGLSSRQKIHVSGDVTRQLVSSLYFCMCSGGSEKAQVALSCLRRKSLLTLSTSAVLNARALVNIVELSEKASSQFHCLPALRMRNLPHRGRAPLSSISRPNPQQVGSEGVSARTPKSPPSFGQHLRPPRSAADDASVEQLDHVYEDIGNLPELSVENVKVALSMLSNSFEAAVSVEEIELTSSAFEYRSADVSITRQLLHTPTDPESVRSLQTVNERSHDAEVVPTSGGACGRVPIIKRTLVGPSISAPRSVSESSEDLSYELMGPVAFADDESRLIVHNGNALHNVRSDDAESSRDDSVSETESFSDDKRANSFGEHEHASLLLSRSDKESKKTKVKMDDSLVQKRCVKPSVVDSSSPVTLSGAIL